ncbi:MAG: sigma-70 family RNA polymerase sigma factor [Candidatus Kryptoniota bacterium]
MIDRRKEREFETIILPHLDAAYNLARWIARNDRDAEDIVQEACLRALQSFEDLQGKDGRPWFMTIVRNVSYTLLSSHKLRESNSVEFEDDAHSSGSIFADPATLIEREFDKQMLKTALEKLPDELREVIVLRELESFSYKEIAHIMNVPIGTVMSRLARGRASLQRQLSANGIGD